jgi:hypothetical protein
VRAKLQYIKDMGFGALWLSPVLKNPKFDTGAYHGYGIQNFLAVEPRFASAPGQEETEFRKLADDAHQIGLYVIFDMVLHHAGNVFAYIVPDGAGVKAVDGIDWQGNVATIGWRDATGKGDPAWRGTPVMLRWQVRRFCCDDDQCEQRIFPERLEPLAPRRWRTTRRLDQALGAIGVECGGEPGRRLSAELGIHVSETRSCGVCGQCRLSGS